MVKTVSAQTAVEPEHLAVGDHCGSPPRLEGSVLRNHSWEIELLGRVRSKEEPPAPPGEVELLGFPEKPRLVQPAPCFT